MNSIYIHIPFCDTLCSYCDFVKVINYQKFVDKYLEKLLEEISSKYQGELIKTIYIGGGTPSALNVDQIKELFTFTNFVNIDSRCEITFECNVENLTEEKLLTLYNLGVNRLSIGVQTFNERLLKIINRKHQYNDINNVVDIAKKIGFNNINIDLIFNLPTQTIDELKLDLELFTSLDVKHISIYSLIIEKKSVFYHKGITVDEDMDSEMFEYIIQYLKSHGYSHYEISNFCKKGYESKHNLVYWNNNNYYGFGLGAHGYIDNVRYSNTSSITKYLKENIVKNIELSTQDIMEEYVFLGLRKLEGISLNAFYEKFSVSIFEVFELEDLVGSLLEIENGYLKLSANGLFLANEVFLRVV